jgi:hypothetical protein
MTSAAAMPIEIVKLLPLGDLDAAACEGDFCAIPEHHTQAVINRKLDDDAV